MHITSCKILLQAPASAESCCMINFWSPSIRVGQFCRRLSKRYLHTQQGCAGPCSQQLLSLSGAHSGCMSVFVFYLLCRESPCHAGPLQTASQKIACSSDMPWETPFSPGPPEWCARVPGCAPGQTRIPAAPHSRCRCRPQRSAPPRRRLPQLPQRAPSRLRAAGATAAQCNVRVYNELQCMLDIRNN